MLLNLYRRVLRLAASPYAGWWLALIAFAEASFFPVPPDALLIPMALANPRRSWWFATICTVASVAGGALGYLIGFAVFDQLARPILDLYGYGAAYAAFQAKFQEYGIWIILIKGLTPIPYKLVTIASGAAHFDLFTFVWASIVTRGIRFFAVSALLWKFGEPIRAFIEKRLALVTWVFLIALIGGFVAFRYLF
jgi:membrane protein YqaA with SNARE-associated domain